MIVARNDKIDRAVLGPNVGTVENKEEDPEFNHRYFCLSCGGNLEYNMGSTDDTLAHFLHEEDDCIDDGNVSTHHRIGQEVVSGALYNWLSEQTDDAIRIDIERRIGGHSDFVISDVRISHPRQIAVEIVYRSSHIALKRRLRRMYENDYDMLLVCLDNGRFSPDRIQRHLQKVSSIRVGRFDPISFELTLGSIITPDEINPETTDWHTLPNYLS